MKNKAAARKKSKKSPEESSKKIKLKSKVGKPKHSTGQNVSNGKTKKKIKAAGKQQPAVKKTKQLSNGSKKLKKKNKKKLVKEKVEPSTEPKKEPKTKSGKHDQPSKKITPILKTAGSIQKPKNIRHENTKAKLKTILETEIKRSSIKSSGSALRERMLGRLQAAQFRYLNEKLYLSEGKDAKEMFKSDPTSFKIYHDGFRRQVKKWPINPLEVIIKQIGKMPKDTKVADMGCGEGELAKRVQQRVRSFDLVSSAAGVEECDMAHTPLLSGEMDVAVYCLALMGTNMKEYLVEANRILKVGGTMKIAEVESRFRDVNAFIQCVECYGFKVTRVDDSKKVFYFLDFKKLRDLGSKRGKLPHITLEPCLYKKR